MKLSYSEADTLSSCEQRWFYKYAEKRPDPPGRGMQLGTLLHVADARWIAGEGSGLPVEWEDDYSGKLVRLEDFPDDVVDDAEWLIDRWVEHYGTTPSDEWEIVSTERWIDFEVNGIEVKARLDGLIRERSTGRLWLRELKSYSRGQRLDIVEVSPQETIYAIGVEEHFGERPFGILFDGIYTYRWVKPRPVADSFDRLWTDRTPGQIDKALGWLEAVADRKHDLTQEGPFGHKHRTPVLNIGVGCKSCPYRSECWDELLDGGSWPDEIEVEE